MNRQNKRKKGQLKYGGKSNLIDQTLDKFFSTSNYHNSSGEKTIDTSKAFCDTTVSQNDNSAILQCRRTEIWERVLKIDGWSSSYRSVNNLLTYLGIRKSGSEAARKTYSSIIYRFCARFNVDPDTLVKMPKNRIKEMVEEIIKEMRKKGRSLWYIATTVNVLKTFFRVNGLNNIEVSPPSIPPRYSKRSEYIPTPSEALKMAEVAGNLRDKSMILLMAFSGLRVSTLLALRYKDVKDELEKGVENVQIKVYPEMKEVVANACKGNIRYYTFTIKKATKTLKLYIEERKRAFGDIEDDEPLFITNYNQIRKEMRRKRPLSARQVNRIVKNAAKAAGLERWREVTPHSLRKTFQSFLRNQPEATRLDIRDQEFLFGHVMEGSMDFYYDWGKVEELREKFSKMIPNPSKAKVGKKKKQKIIDVNEVENYLENGWIVRFKLPDGRMIVETEF